MGICPASITADHMEEDPAIQKALKLMLHADEKAYILFTVHNGPIMNAFAPVSITARAQQEVRNIISQKSIPEEYGLRIGIRGAGCVGVSYLLGFDKKKDSDITYGVDGIDVYVDKKHVLYLVGVTLDYYEASDAKGFLFQKPQEDERMTDGARRPAKGAVESNSVQK